MIASEAYGPFCDGLERSEQLARLRSLRAIAMGVAHRNVGLHAALRRAESLAPADLAAAYAAIEAAPAITRRKILSCFSELMR
jgi:hypothetical protein